MREGDIFIANDPYRRRRHASARRQHGDAGVRRRRARRPSSATSPITPTSAASRRAAWRAACRDLPGGPAHPADPAVPPGRAAERHARPAAAQRARAGGAARRLFRPDRGLPARRARASRDARRATAARIVQAAFERHHRPHRRAACATAIAGHPRRQLRLRRRDGRRRRWDASDIPIKLAHRVPPTANRIRCSISPAPRPQVQGNINVTLNATQAGGAAMR